LGYEGEVDVEVEVEVKVEVEVMVEALGGLVEGFGFRGMALNVEGR
jgi:hypothetical protein